MFQGRGASATALAVLAASLGLTGVARGADGVRRIGTAPRIAVGARRLGTLAGSTPLRVTVAIEPRDPAGLAAYAAGVSTPGSADYRQYLSVGAFAARFGAAPATIAAVARSLGESGLSVGAAAADGLSVSVTGTAQQMSSAFGTTLDRVELPSGVTGYVNAQAPAVASSVASDVAAVIGLDTLHRETALGIERAAGSARANKASAAHAASTAVSGCAAATAATQGGGYTDDQLATLYGFDNLYGAGAEGAGERLALVEFEGNFPQDIAPGGPFQSCYGTNVPVNYTEVDGGPTAPSKLNGDGEETSLDADNAIALAPKLSAVDIYQAPADASSYDMYQQIISANTDAVISTSWGLCEPDLQSGEASAENTLFEEAATQGQSVLAASGDTGAQDCDGDGTSLQTAPAVDDPASQPFVTGAGATTITSTNPLTQSVWNSGGHASGGGDSATWPMPSYQSGAASSLGVVNAESSTACGGECREVPDVSGDGDPATGWTVYYGDDSGGDGSWEIDGGTSSDSPFWAALVAIIDGSCGARVGFLNPALYSAAGYAYSTFFDSVPTGNNDQLGTNGGVFAAGPEYDQATGLGTPVAAPLATALCDGTVSFAQPATRTANVGHAASIRLTATTAHGGATYGASGLPHGLSINSSSGLISGTPATAGVYTVTATAANIDSSASRQFAVVVGGLPTLSAVTIAGAARGRPATSFRLRAGTDAAGLTRITLTLPGGLTAARSGARLARLVTVRGTGGARLPASISASRGTIVITLRSPATQVSVTIAATALKETTAFQKAARRHARASVTVAVVDASAVSSRLSARVRTS